MALNKRPELELRLYVDDGVGLYSSDIPALIPGGRLEYENRVKTS